MGLTLMVRGHIAFFYQQNPRVWEFLTASLGVFDREFRGMEQQEKPRVREFREHWIASLRGLSVFSFEKQGNNRNF